MSVHSFMVKSEVCLGNPQNMAPPDSHGDAVVESISLFLTQCLSVKQHTTTAVLHPQRPTAPSRINPSGADGRSGRVIQVMWLDTTRKVPFDKRGLRNSTNTSFNIF